MKIFVFIVSVYIMALSVMPCLDSFTCEGEKSSATISGIHDHSEDEGDLCSPFCICSCCGCSFVGVNIPVFFSQSLKTVEQRINVPYYSQFNSSYYHSFWQPPKLS
jgi:hypothetical protein